MKKKTNLIKLAAETEKTTAPSVILQKKLSELESKLADLYRLPLDPTSAAVSTPFHDEIKQSFVFLNNLLHQEIASAQPQNPDELHEIGRRFTALQVDFLRWNELRHSVCEGEFSDEISPPEKTTSGSLAGETIGSKRDACTQVVPHDDDDDDSGDVTGEETTEKCFDIGVEMETSVRKEEVVVVVMKEKVWGKMVKYSVAFGCGMIVGAVCMANLFFISYYHHNYLYYEPLVPLPT